MAKRLDELDWKIITILSRNGRTSNVEIARQLDEPESTVRHRIKRLIAAELLNVIAITNRRNLGYIVDALVGIKVRPGRVREVASSLAELPETRYVGVCTGRFDIIAFTNFRSETDLHDFLVSGLPHMRDVTSTETLHVLRTFKGLDIQEPPPMTLEPGRPRRRRAFRARPRRKPQ